VGKTPEKPDETGTSLTRAQAAPDPRNKKTYPLAIVDNEIQAAVAHFSGTGAEHAANPSTVLTHRAKLS
jgi:hypothetical protein